MALLIAVLLDARVVVAQPGPQTVAGCPAGSIQLAPGVAMQALVEAAPEGAMFCLRRGVHRGQTIRPKTGQRFVGEGPDSILSGARVVREFVRVGDVWSAPHRLARRGRHGICEKGEATCGFADAAFIDDVPLRRVLERSQLAPGRFMIDTKTGELLIADDPAGHKVEVTHAAFAFISPASDVLIENLLVEKYASPAQQGAIQGATAWIVRRVEARLNSGAAVAIRTRGRIESSFLHHNGQLGARVLDGRDIRLEDNEIAHNNTRRFDRGWEAGGVKITLGEEVAVLRNHVHDNFGPGLWCDIECREVLYEGNIVENNSGPGIWHEISFSAIIRNNLLRTNGIGDRIWYWDSEIQIASSSGVEVYANTLTVRHEGGGVMLIDQRREKDSGGIYRTQNNSVHHNDVTFLGDGDMGGVSDARTPEGDDMIISKGANSFDFNTYRLALPDSWTEFVWGHATFDWDGFRRMGQEKNGIFIFSQARPGK